MGDILIRREAMMQQASSEPAISPLIELGTKTFNLCTYNTTTRHVKVTLNNKSLADAYNVKRYFNLTKFSDNVTTGTGNTGGISNKTTGRIIPAGSTCVFSVSNVSITNQYSASYAYIALLLRNIWTGNILRIGLGGNNVPATSASKTVDADTEIGCIAVELSHMSGFQGRIYEADVSLTVDGVEWL